MKVKLIIRDNIIYGFDSLCIEQEAVEITEKQADLIIANSGAIDINFNIRQDLKIKQQKENQILGLKQNLSSTDYQAIKYAEGQITEEDYQPIKAQRQAWREEINKLEEECDLLNS